VSSWAVDPQFGKDHSAVFVLDHPLAAPAGTALTFTLKFNNNVRHSIGRPRLAVTADANPSLEGASSSSLIAEAIRVLEKPAAQRTSETQRSCSRRIARRRGGKTRRRRRRTRATAEAGKSEALICSGGVPPAAAHDGADFYEETFCSSAAT
jgi:hypothetical protein